MKIKNFLIVIAAIVLTACNNDDMMPDAPNEGLIELASVGIGTQTRGSVDDDGQFSFSNGDKVLMTVEVNENSFSNSFTYNGGKWTQDAPVGDYRSIYVQDSPTINSIVSYGGKAEEGVYTDQSSMESYAMASSLAADPMRYLGDITIDGNVVTARLDHDNSDLALKVYDGYDEKNTLAENTPVLKVIVDEDGSGSDSKLLTFTAWNAGKSTDSDGTYTLFRVQLPAGCSILEAELSNVNETAGGLKTDILFRASDGQPSNEIDLEAGRRYSASYTYDMLKTVATVNVSISPFEGGDLDHDIIASSDWSFDEATKTYTVFTAEGLQIVNQDIAKNIATKGNYNITLAADITLPEPTEEGGRNWRPLSINSRYPYNGTFDGAGHTITNLVVRYEYANYISLIGYAGVESVVKNVTLANPVMQADFNEVGGIAGHSSGVISNCHIRGGNFNAGFSVSIGGICGMFDGSEITGCTVSGFTINGFTELGGICGRVENSKINSCIVSGVTIKEENQGSGFTFCVGGIVGYTKESTVTANISENNTLEGKDHIGAIYGYTEGNNTIEVNTVTTCTLNGTEVDGKNN